MMVLNEQQQRLVEDNMGLVGRVIKDKVRDVQQIGIYTYDDLFQIGCMGLCKAAVTDKGGCFSTYAYRLIWHSICDALIYANRQRETELVMEEETLRELSGYEERDSELGMDLNAALCRARADTSPCIQKGIDALCLSAKGYTSAQIGERLDAAPNQVRALMSKAKRYLQTRTELCALCGEVQ